MTNTAEERRAALAHVREQMAILTDPLKGFGPSARVDVGARILLLADAIDALAAELLRLTEPSPPG